ncbi:MAG: hypothetical protein ABIJ40_08595 [Bacteroidota bacterium]
MLKYLKQPFKPIYFRILRIRDTIRFHRYLKNHRDINIIIGSSRTKYEGWFSSEQYFLDISKQSHFQRILKERKISKILAEHVLEHLTEKDLSRALRNFSLYSSENVNIRIAVPDGNHPDSDYIQSVKPNKNVTKSHGHQVLFNYKTLSAAFRKHGFEPKLLEYWDEKSHFNSIYQNDENGFVYRSFLNDSRNASGKPNYTSLIIDFFKK